MTEDVERVAGVELRRDGNGFLDVAAEDRAIGAAHLKNGHTILVTNVQLAHGASFKRRHLVRSLKAEDEVVNVVFMEQGSQVVFFALGFAVLGLLAHEKAAKGIEEQQTDRQTDDTDGEEVKEGKTFTTVVAQIAIHNQVGRRTDERQDATH